MSLGDCSWLLVFSLMAIGVSGMVYNLEVVHTGKENRRQYSTGRMYEEQSIWLVSWSGYFTRLLFFCVDPQRILFNMYDILLVSFVVSQ